MPLPTKLLNGAWRLILGEPVKREPYTSTGETMTDFYKRAMPVINRVRMPANSYKGPGLPPEARCDDCATEFKQTKAEKFNV
jgi:hypothetical protein